MTASVRIILLVASVLTLVFTLKKIRHAQIKIEHSLFWILLSVLFIFMSLCPGLVTWVSKRLGFQAPVNLIFLSMIFILFVKLFYNSILISKLERKIEVLTQEIAVNETMKEKKESTNECLEIHQK